MTKKLLCVCLAFIFMVSSVVGVAVSAENGFAANYWAEETTDESDGINDGYNEDIVKYLSFTINNGEVTITDCDRSLSGKIKIPEKVGRFTVTAIGENAFYDCYNIKSIIIPDTVRYIGEGAFHYCTNLTSVSIPDSVTNIRSRAFARCTSLESIVIPDSVTDLSDEIFYNCYNLKSVVLGNGIRYISNYTFYNCTSLENVVIGDSVVNIFSDAFCRCLSLKSITIPDSVNSIYSSTFSGCTSLESVTFGTGLTRINDSAFSGCSNLKSIAIPQNVTNLGKSVFSNCTNLESIAVYNPECGLYYSYNTFPECATIYGYPDSTAQFYAEIYDRNFVALCNSHIRETVVTPPTCTAQGYTTDVCSECGFVFDKYDYMPVLNHIDNDGDDCCDGCTYVFPRISSGESVYVNTNGGTAFVKFIPEENGYYKFFTNYYYDADDVDIPYFHTYGYVYDSQMNLLAYDDDGSERNFRIEHYFTAGETYYLACCYSQIDESMSGLMNIRLNRIAGDETTTEPSWEEESTWDGPDYDYVINAGESLNIYVESYNTTYIKFTPEESGYYRFSSDSASDTYGYVYDEYMNICASDDDAGVGTNFCIDYYFTAGETYYLGCRYYNSSSCGWYYVTLAGPSDEPSSEEPSYEETTSAPVYDVPSYSGYIYAGESRTVYVTAGYISLLEFNPTESGYYVFHSGSAYNGDTYGYIYDADMNQLTCNDDGGDNNNFRIEYYFDAGETYYLGCRYWNRSNSGSYNVTLERVFEEESSDYEEPTTRYENYMSEGIIDAGETKWVKVTGGYISTIEFTPQQSGWYRFYSNSDNDTYGYLYDYDMNQLAASDDYYGSDFCIEYYLEAGETYYFGCRYYDRYESGSYDVTLEMFTQEDTSDSEEPVYGMRGDVDGDGYTTAADARITLRVSARLEVAPDNYSETMDVNYDGRITASDARNILRIATMLDYDSEFAPVRTDLDCERTDDAQIYYSYNTPYVGETLNLTISAENIEGLQSGNLFINYDPNMLEFVDIFASPSASFMHAGGNPEYGLITFSFMQMGCIEKYSESLVTIEFRVLNAGGTWINTSIGTWEGAMVPYNADLYLYQEYREPETTVPPTTEPGSSYYPEYEGFYYYINEYDEAVITGYSGAIDENAVIPDELDGYPVTGIDGGAFSYNYYITSVTFGSNLRKIGNYAFNECRYLRYVNLSDSVEYIGYGAFRNTALESITVYNPRCVLEYDADTLPINTVIYGYINSPAHLYAQMYGREFVALSDECAHDYVEVVTEPTCTQKGYTVYICVCGDYYIADETDALGHSFSGTECVRCGEAVDSTVSIGNVTGRPGETVNVYFTLDNDTPVKSMAVYDVVYDSDKLTLVNGEWLVSGSIISDWNNADETGVITFTDNVTLNGELFCLTFLINDGVEDSTVSVDASFRITTVDGDDDETTLAVAVNPGSVRIVNVLRGDVNGDDIVDSNDAVYLLYHTLLSDRYPINQNGDFNGSGNVNSNDAVYLLYHVLLPERYPLSDY